MVSLLRRLRIGARLGICLGIVVALVSVASIVATVSLSQQRTTTVGLDCLMKLSHDIDTAKYFDGDVSGWQVAYAWDAYRVGGAKAVDPKSENRAGFLSDATQLKTTLAHTHTTCMTATEHRKFDAMRAAWDKFFAFDDQIASAYKAEHLKAADALIMGPSYGVYFSIVKMTDDLVASITTRAAKAVKGANDNARTAQLEVGLALGLGLLLAISIVLLLTWSIARPVRNCVAALQRLAEKDLTVELPTDGSDEIADMARALGGAVSGLRETMSSIATQSTAVATTSEELAVSASNIATSMDETSSQAVLVACASEQVSANVQTVAAGSEEMGASIREISHNANEAAKVAAEAVFVASATTDSVSRLGDSSTEIATVVKTITSIAEQTNLLALNATIEAARAGEAGKGFAVVANEVKDLAQETARATEDISRRVEAIQGDTRSAVDAISEISTIIGRINDFQLTIASAVEEQTATTNEMNRNVAEAATASGEIAANISGVADAAYAGATGLAESQTSIADLAQMAAELQRLVGGFRT